MAFGHVNHARTSIYIIYLFLIVVTISQGVETIKGAGNDTVLKNLPGSEVVCSDTNWYDIVWFYFANYIMHALSVRSLPGENFITSFLFKFACLLIPFTGIRRGLCLISRSSNFVRNDLQAAARANALCMIVRGEKWKPRTEDEIEGCSLEVVGGAEQQEPNQELTTEARREYEGQSEENMKSGTSDTSKSEAEIGITRQSTLDVPPRSDTVDSQAEDHSNENESGSATPISPVSRLKTVLTGSTLAPSISSDLEKPKDSKKSRRFQPLSKIKEKSTSKPPSSDDPGDGNGKITIKLWDFYKPLPPANFLVKLYQIFVESYKFGRSSVKDSIKLDPEYTKVHGLCNLPPGYELVYVPPDVKIHPRGTPRERPNLLASLRSRNAHNISKAVTSHTRLASTQNAPRILFSLFQTISAAWSLYRAQGIQIQQFGYAAYGLTVLPYMIVSVINFLGSFLTKEYDMVYLVHSQIMDEMVARGGSVDGVVGSVDPRAEDLAEPSIPTNSAQAIKAKVRGGAQELLTPEGQVLQVKLDDSSTEDLAPSTTDSSTSPPASDTTTSENENESPTFLTYRTFPTSSSSDSASSWSTPLHLVTPLNPKPPPPDPIAPNQENWRECRRQFQIKFRHRDPNAEILPRNLTILHVPCHGPLVRFPPPVYEPFVQAFTLALLIIAIAAPYIVITLLSGWASAHSESRDRTFVINWLVCGMTLGYAAGSVERLTGNRAILRAGAIVFVSYGSYCIGGFVMVAQQMLKIGKCEPL